MKRLILISISLCFTLTLFVTLSSSTRTVTSDIEDPKFTAQWKKVDSLERKGLYRMAMTEVGKIFDAAAKAELHNQVIKSVLFELKYNTYLEEDDYVLGIARLDELVKKAPSPSKEILHSLIAEVYWGYYSSNSWKFQDRTTVIEADLKDVRTWDLKRIAAKVRHHYLLSLDHYQISQSKMIKDYDEIVNNSSYSNEIRPTLFDFLAHRALDFFKGNQFNVPGNADQFVIEEGQYFSGNKTFLSLKPVSKDSLNTDFFAVRLFQELTRFHADKNNIQPLFHVELERLKYVNNKAFHPEKDQLYYSALQRMTNAFTTHPFVSEAWYEIAMIHYNKGNAYSPVGDTTARWEKKIAVDICTKTIEKYPDVYGSQQCAALKNTIEQKDMQIRSEQSVAVQSNSKFLIEYKNVDKLYLKIAPYDYKRVNEGRYKWDKFVEELRGIKGIYNKEISLTDPGDFQRHSIEELIPKLANGFYYIIVGSEPDFSESDAAFSFMPIWITDITYQTRKIKNTHHMLVSDRTSGKPLSGAKVTVTYKKYNYRLYRDETKTIGNYTTDANGLVSFDADGDYRTYNFIIKHADQIYAPDEGVYSYRYYERDDSYYSSTIFTDRKIYRPGQTIYFKGIIINYTGDERKLVPNHQTTVRFYDVNGEEVGHQLVTTNEFGSYEGKFTAPFGVLTGQMRIVDSYNSQYFRVEEYKRPKFFVEMDPVEGEFKVNDEITVTGKAQAYAGNMIDGADVKYRVVRSTHYSDWWYWWYWRPYQEPKEITHGEVKTDDDGKIELKFNAMPDKSADPKDLPIFTYTIYVDVTDINGEIHSSSTSVIVGYQSLQLGHNISSEMNNSKDYFLRLSTTNLNGQKIPAKGKISIHRLKQPDQVYYNRLWTQPDMQRWSEAEFKALFPNTTYSSENNMYRWDKEKEVFKASFNTAETDSIAIPSYKKWLPGVYVYEATAKDKNGLDITDKYYFTVFSPDAKKSPTNEVLWIRQIDYSYEPGETAEIIIGTAEEDMRIMYEVESKNRKIKSEVLLLSNEQKKLTIPVSEQDRGNITVNFSTVRHNRCYTNNLSLTVPYTDKELDLEFSSFRNKLLPGTDEEWTLTVRNHKGEKESAELLATLYDASLDALYTPNDYYLSVFPYFYGALSWGYATGMSQSYAQNIHYWNQYVNYPYRYFPTLNYQGWNSYYYPGRYYRYKGAYDMDYLETEEDAYYDDGNAMGGAVLEKNIERKESSKKDKITTMADMSVAESADEEVANEVTSTDSRSGEGKIAGNANQQTIATGKDENLGDVKARTNFNETAFFMPSLHTDEKGNIQIKFTIPESLTKWKFIGLAHTKDLKIGTIQKEVVTQKDLMVVPNTPRFLREGDEITLSAKISNISKEDLKGRVQLFLTDPVTEKELEGDFKLKNEQQDFEAAAGKSVNVSWTIQVPYAISAVKYKFVAKAGAYSDGEENVLPILSNRMLVTEALPLPIRGNQTKKFSFDKLKNSAQSTTLRHHAYTLEFTSNPAWYALQAMPYMMEYPYECAEQTFTRYYSNAIATHVMNSNPKIRDIIKKWGEESPEAFYSNLQKNQELKAVMLEETPWVLDAKNEAQSKRNLGVLLDMERMSRELDKALAKTIKTQSANGGWPWFPGMRESRYITQHIITGMGHLDHLGIKDVRENRKVWNMIEKGVDYLDRQIRIDYESAKKWDPNYLKNQHIGYTQVQYLYARSYFPKIGMSKGTKEAVNYYKEQAEKFWLNFNIYAEGMIALAAHRFEMINLSTDIVKSLKDRSIHTEEFGMYWKDYYVGYYWYEAPVETQALMIEMFDEVTNDQESVEELKIWLLKEKQTTNWKTTKQTSEAVYALLLKGSDLLASDELVEISIGGKEIQYVDEDGSTNPYQVKPQAGTGYFKTRWNTDEVKPEMGDITVKKKDKGVAWGAAYWQYFEDLDKITFAENNLKLKKQLFLVETTDDGEVLKPINDNNTLHVGDKVRCRIELRTDRNLEYVHMKDMRASGFEPINVLSRYYYQDGLGYYQATKDAATNFFFDYVPKGTYVFEYSMWVQHKGNFSNGITSIQCMYAPEFTSHSEGIRVKVE